MPACGYKKDPHPDYTTIEDAVNVAQRLQSIAEDGQIVISELAYDKVKESFNCRKTGEVNLKNKAKPVKVYVYTRYWIKPISNKVRFNNHHKKIMKFHNSGCCVMHKNISRQL